MEDDSQNLTRNLNIKAEWQSLGLVLDMFNVIETKMAQAIRLYIEPNDQRAIWVEKRLLNNQIVGFASKIKLVLSIARELNGPKLDVNNFQRLLNIRNAMAHGELFSALRTREGPPADAKDLVAGRAGPREAYLVVESIKSNGDFHEVPRVHAVGEFVEIADKVNGQMRELLILMGATMEAE